MYNLMAWLTIDEKVGPTVTGENVILHVRGRDYFVCTPILSLHLSDLFLFGSVNHKGESTKGVIRREQSQFIFNCGCGFRIFIGGLQCEWHE